MSTKHKHADLIIQWAIGTEVQIKDNIEGKWYDCLNPRWEPDCEYRIKQQPKADIVVFATMEGHLKGSIMYCTTLCGCFSQQRQTTDNIKVTYSGETGKLIAIEMIEQE